MQKRYPAIIFCDFDGTITSEDTFIGALLHLLGPEEISYWGKQLQSGTITLPDCAKILFSKIPSDRKKDIQSYAKTVPFRSGFAKFIEYCHQINIPVVVISGGIKWMQSEMLGTLCNDLLDFHSCDVDTSEPFMHFICHDEEKDVCIRKDLIMDRYLFDKAICIGDGVVDLPMAKRASFTFARDHLAQMMQQENLPYIPWNDFYEIQEKLGLLIPCVEEQHV